MAGQRRADAERSGSDDPVHARVAGAQERPDKPATDDAALTAPPNTTQDLPVTVRRGGSGLSAPDHIAREVAVALVYNGISHAVMMATPADLADFALGFSLTEGIVMEPAEVYDCAVQVVAQGISVELEIASERLAGLRQRRRSLAGRSGCGLCGIESLEEAVGPPTPVQAPRLDDAAVQRAVAALQQHQPLQARTGATHGAAWCRPDGSIVLAREDVGRHNALDKVVGALASAGRLGDPGFLLVSSRASYELVHKSCAVGIGALVSVSAATSFAVEQARCAGQLLIGFARPGRHVIYHDPHAPRPSGDSASAPANGDPGQ